MQKYIIGFIIGILSYAIVGHLVQLEEPSELDNNEAMASATQTDPDSEFKPITENMKPEHSSPFSNAVTNLLFETTRPRTDMFEPFKNDTFPILTLDSISPVHSFSRKDLHSVCLADISTEGDFNRFSIHMYLTPEARRLMGHSLSSRNGQEHAFRILGLTVNSFFVDKDRAAYLAEHAETYPLYPYEDHADNDSDDTFFVGYPDISFPIDKNTTYQGLMLAKYAAGSNELEACDPEENVSDIPGYAEHLVYWKDLQENGPRQY